MALTIDNYMEDACEFEGAHASEELQSEFDSQIDMSVSNAFDDVKKKFIKQYGKPTWDTFVDESEVHSKLDDEIRSQVRI